MEHVIGQLHPELKCKICNAPLYCTDHGNREATYHCSSAEARFWDFNRDDPAQMKSKAHWDQSKTDVYF